MVSLFNCCNDLLEVAKEAFYSLKNVIFNGSSEELVNLLHKKIIEVCVKFMKGEETELIIESFKIMDKLMEKCEYFWGSYVK